MMHRGSWAVIGAIALSACRPEGEGEGEALGFTVERASWTATSLMTTARWSHRATRLADGRVLVTGGTAEAASVSAEIYDPKAGAWTATKQLMPTPHSDHVASLLCDGRVLVAGGFSSDSTASRTAAIYDPVADLWTKAKPMHFGHTYGTATLLQGSCRVLVAGGYDALNRSEVYDPVADQWTTSASSLSQTRFYHTATPLQDGRVVVAGGGYDELLVWYTLPNVDVYDPATGKWSLLASLHDERRSHAATLLRDGKLLVTGGSDGGQDDGVQAAVELQSVEIYDPGNRQWTLGPSLPDRRTAHTATLLDNGAVLVAGGIDETGSALSSTGSYHEGGYSPTPPMTRDRYLHTATLLEDGAVLLAGGLHQASAEIYRLDADGAPCASPDTCESGACVDGVCCHTACADGCMRCDVPGAVGTCASPCLDATHASACADDGGTCAAATSCTALRCTPFLCTAAARGCATSCAGVADCAPGFACSADHLCVAPPAAVDGDPGACDLGPGPGPGRDTAIAVIAIAAAAGIRRRRYPRARSTASSATSSRSPAVAIPAAARARS
jgi:N-acetylneuraminic acid mutarotase